MLLGIDVGGTHTDAVAVAPDGIRASCKVRTDPEDLLSSLKAALEIILETVDPFEVEQLNLSTTLSTNAIVQGKIEDVGVLVSAGPGIAPDNYMICRDFHVLSGSIDHRGTEIAPLDPDEVERAIEQCLEAGVRVFASVGKFSTRNPAHEKMIKEMLKDRAEFTTMGHEITGRLNFPRRLATAYYNASVWRVYNRFADAVGAVLYDLGLSVPVNVLKADGGAMPLAESRNLPVQSIFSGPAASVMGIIALCDIFHDSIILDIGGTTTDIAVFAGGAPLIENDGIEIGSNPTLVQALKVRSIGIGGDSAISVLGEVVRVGPNRLGPAAANGGQRPTLTDALNFLGYSGHGDIGASKRALADFAASHSIPVETLARKAVDHAVDAIHDAAREFLARINERPVYTIHELLEGKRIIPRKIYIMGGPAKAMERPLFARFRLSVEVPGLYGVANAVGAALTRTTRDVVLFADTEKGVALIPSLGFHKTVPRDYGLDDAESDVRAALSEHLQKSGAKVGPEHLLIAAASSFNMVSGNRTVGRNIRVRCRVKPGVTHTLQG